MEYRYRTDSGSGKYIGFGLLIRIGTGTERATIVDIFDSVLRNTGIHLRVDDEQWRIARGSKRQAGGSGPLAHYLSRLRRTDAPHT